MNSLEELSQRDLVSLLDTVCARHHVTRDEVCGANRTRMVSFARHELWWMLRHHAELRFSLQEIGRIFDRNHTTVLHGIRAWERVRERRARHVGLRAA